MLPSQFKLLVQAMRAELGAIKEAIQKHENTTRNQAVATSQKQEDHAGAIATEIRVAAQGAANYEQPQRDKEYRQQNRMIGITATAGVAAAIYAAIAGWQLCTMNRTYREIQKQTTLMKQQMVGTYAAVVEADAGPQIGDLSSIDFGITLTLTNHGKVIATNASAEGTLVRQAIPGFRDIGTPISHSTSEVQLVPLDSGEPQHRTATLVFDTGQFSELDIQAIRAMRQTIRLSGTYSYQDGFGDSYLRPFCFLFLSLHNPDGSASQGWTSCDEGKVALSGTLRRQERSQNGHAQ